MFQNNNKEIVKRLAHRSFRADKRRNWLSILTVVIAVGMMTAVALLPTETLQTMKAEDEGTPQAAFAGISQSAVSALKKSPDVEWVGEQTAVASTQTGDDTINTLYIDQPMLKASKLTLKGAMPEKSDEILLEQSFLTHIGSKAKAGDSISLDLGNGKKEYTITGVLDSNSADSKNYAVIVSKAFMQGIEKTDSLKTSTYVRLRNTDKMSDDGLNQAIYSLTDKAGISRDDVSIVPSKYRVQEKNSAANVLGIAALAAIILFGAVLVIYSIFYISVNSKIHEYGQLRTIGTTKKQIKGIVYREGLRISAIGVPAGLIIGGIVGYFLAPKGWNLVNTLWIVVIIGIIGFLSVLFSVRTPAKIAANTSPIEAVRYTAYKGKALRKKSRRITPFRLAVTSLSRNRKKSVLTLLSLGFSGILLLCAATMAVSYSAVDEAKTEFPYGSYKISLSTKDVGNADFSINRIQANTPLNGQLKNELLSIKGVKEILEWSSTSMSYKLPNGKDSGGASTVYAFSSDETQKMKPYLTQGKLDYSSMTSQNGIAICYSQIFKEVYGWNPKIGDPVKVTLLNNKGETVEQTFTVTALLNGNYRQAYPSLWMPVDVMNKIAGMGTVSDFEIVTDSQDQAAIGSSLKSIAEKNSYLEYYSLKDLAEENQKSMQPTFNMMYIFIAFLSLFGLINLINTTITNLLSRKREIGTLQAIGLSSRQLNRMLQTEGLLYTAGTAAFTLTVGTAFGYAVYLIVKRLGMSLHYHYPVIPVCIFIAALLIIQVFISAFTVQNLKKQSLIERISAE
jgi:putative ABC transport system permease protein